MLAEAPQTNGIVNTRLETYPGSYTSIIAHTASGTGELHKRLQDNFFVVSGRIIDPKESAPDEIRGTRVEGGESRVMHKGDVLHVPANTPHQTVLAPGATFVYYVVKVEEPTARMMPAAK